MCEIPNVWKISPKNKNKTKQKPTEELLALGQETGKMLGKRGDWEPVFRDCCIIMAARETG